MLGLYCEIIINSSAQSTPLQIVNKQGLINEGSPLPYFYFEVDRFIGSQGDYFPHSVVLVECIHYLHVFQLFQLVQTFGEAFLESMGGVFDPKLEMFQFLECDEEMVKSHRMFIAPYKIEIKGIFLIVSSSLYYQLFDVLGNMVHLINNLSVCLPIDCVAQSLTILYSVEVQQFKQAVVFISLTEPQNSQVAITVRTFKLNFFVDYLRNTFCAKCMATDKNPWKFLPPIEFLEADSAFKIIFDLLLRSRVFHNKYADKIDLYLIGLEQPIRIHNEAINKKGGQISKALF